ncbi:hypothetical protein Poly59_02430 [Rubripirellula reticaptiva]|uniref:Uncharacterized protein n=1 Tax=Rubripirellula reticaptiva TaxID=2528013 RepID=A0A5C6FB09_9BACT|nr:hypothetical protein Poly59_02430 [Rubripirellula reticaptiva]
MLRVQSNAQIDDHSVLQVTLESRSDSHSKALNAGQPYPVDGVNIRRIKNVAKSFGLCGDRRKS